MRTCVLVLSLCLFVCLCKHDYIVQPYVHDIPPVAVICRSRTAPELILIPAVRGVLYIVHIICRTRTIAQGTEWQWKACKHTSAQAAWAGGLMLSVNSTLQCRHLFHHHTNNIMIIIKWIQEITCSETRMQSSYKENYYFNRGVVLENLILLLRSSLQTNKSYFLHRNLRITTQSFVFKIIISISSGKQCQQVPMNHLKASFQTLYDVPLVSIPVYSGGL